MKKITTILLILCVTAAIFAASGLSLKLGGDFDLIFLRTTKVESSGKTHQFKSNGIGFDVGAQYDFSKSIMAYADFNMVFPSDYEVSNDKDSKSYKFSDEVKEFEEKGNKVRSGIFFINATAGVAYKFDFDAFKLAVGAGFYYNILMSSLKVTGTGLPERVNIVKLSTIGLSSMIEAKYMVTDKIGVCLTAMPQIGFFSNRNISNYMDGEKIYDNSLVGFGLSFTMPVSIGASYAF